MKRTASARAARAVTAAVALAAAALSCIAAAPSAHAGSLQVAPVRVVLNQARPVAAMTIGNAEDAEVAVQAEVFAWSQVDGKDVYEPTRDVLVNPTIFRLAAQAQQIVRLGLRVPAGEREKSYRIFLQQLPRDRAVPTGAAANGSGGTTVQIQTLLRIGVPIFVPPPAARRDVRWRIESSDAGPAAAPSSPSAPRYRLKVKNDGDEHIQLTQVVLRHDDGSELRRKSLSHYVLAGQASTLPVELPPLAAGSTFNVEVQSDAAAPLPSARLRVPGEGAPR
jgi:fimbrial chaperone protein